MFDAKNQALLAIVSRYSLEDEMKLLKYIVQSVVVVFALAVMVIVMVIVVVDDGLELILMRVHQKKRWN
jgi:hypothetical protein